MSHKICLYCACAYLDKIKSKERRKYIAGNVMSVSELHIYLHLSMNYLMENSRSHLFFGSEFLSQHDSHVCCILEKPWDNISYFFEECE